MMKKRKEGYILVCAAFALMLLILDSKAALAGAKEGVSLCIFTVLPSLFPFFFFCNLINSRLLGYRMRPLRPICRLCGIPEGAESILVIGLLGGYPIGAQAITQAYTDGHISESTAKRMLGFCSNAGPAFIFGMLSAAFSSWVIPWFLWGIHILSALITGAVLPGKTHERCTVQNKNAASISDAMEQSIRSIAKVCGWVILFRIILTFMDRWFLWLLQNDIRVLLAGFTELSNGCILLQTVEQEYPRFILCSCMLSFGGVCVGMQTAGVTRSLGTGLYLPGKLLQTIFSFLLATLTGRFLFPDQQVYILLFPIILILTGLFLFILHQIDKKNVAFRKQSLYNSRKQAKEVAPCFLDEKSNVPVATALMEPKLETNRYCASSTVPFRNDTHATVFPTIPANASPVSKKL